MSKLTLQDISRSLNISKSTVSLVLNGRGDEIRVSKETQERILEFAREHNYTVNRLARGLSRGISDLIGLIIPNISDSFYARIATSIEKNARLYGYNVVFSSSGESKDQESELIQSMLDRQVDGLIIASSQKNDEDIRGLKRSNTPFVLIDRRYPEIETNFVGVDNFDGIASAVEQLILTGRKRIAFISLKPGLVALQERLEGYIQTLDIHGLSEDQSLVRELAYENIESDMPHIIEELVHLPKGVDALVFATHFLAAAGLRTLKKLGIKIPEEVAIISFGQMSAFDLIEPPISSVIQPTDELGKKAVDLLVQNMKNENHGFENRHLKTCLLVRESCGLASAVNKVLK